MQDLKTIIDHVKANSPDPEKCMIAFSGGKDAWGVWGALKEHFDLYPFYYYLVPGLEVVEEYLGYCERKIGKPIVRLPNPRMFTMLNERVFMPWERIPLMMASEFPEYDWATSQDVARACMELPEGIWSARGIRAADSVARGSAILKHGAWSDKNRTCDPIWDWKKPDIIDNMKRHKIRLSPEYLAFGRTFDGVYLLYAWGLKKHFPRDYRRCLEFFPYMEAEIFRLEQAIKRYGGIGNLPRDEALTNAALKVAVPEKKVGPSFNFSFGQKAKEAAAAGEQEQKKPDGAYSKLNAESKKMAQKVTSMTDTAFWASVDFSDNSRFLVVFEDRRQREHWIAAMKLKQHGDTYIDGAFLAKSMKLSVSGLSYSQFSFSFGKKKLRNPTDGFDSGDIAADILAGFTGYLKACPAPKTGKGSLAEKFLKAAKWDKITHSTENGLTCIWCHDFASLLGIKLPPTTFFYRPEARPDAKLNAFVG